MIAGSVSRRYAKALLSIGIESNDYEQFGSELDSFADLLKHAGLKEILQNPSYTQAKRGAIVKDLLSRLNLSKPVHNFVLLLTDRNRIGILPQIAEEYRGMADKQAGRIRAHVTTAKGLDSTNLDQLKTVLAQKTKKQVLIEESTDEKLIAGMVTRIGSVVYDGSISTRLTQLRESLLEGKE
ncbi:MAG: F0F1 ATP synthase subunit delta [Pseudomonadota bacterium]